MKISADIHSSPAAMDRKVILLHLLGLAIFSSALYLPNLGRGFIHDDFMWLHDAAFHPIGYELSHPAGQTFFSPLGSLTFRMDWHLWRLQAFPMGVENLLLHIGNSFLLYLLVFLLWRSPAAAWWAGFGFALLFPANTWAVMWIATRAHLLGTFFIQAALCTTIWFARTTRHRFFAGATTTVLAAAAMMSKENGITVILAIPVLLWYLLRSTKPPVPWRGIALQMAALAALAAVYLTLRGRSGAIPILSPGGSYQYILSVQVLIENLLRYAWRTYGLQSLLAGALLLCFKIRGMRVDFDGIGRNEVVLSGLLFVLMLSPVILIRDRSGMYSYLPAVGASLALGAIARSIHTKEQIRPRSWLSAAPILALVAIYASFAVGQSIKWRHMAETNRAILQQLSAQLPTPVPGTLIVLRNEGSRDKAQLSSSFASWSFPSAIQLQYSDPTLGGAILQVGEPVPVHSGPTPIEFMYHGGPDFPRTIQVTAQ